MAEEPTPSAAAPDALHRELARERIQSARRINTVRLVGVSAFFALFVVLGGVLRLPAWMGNLELFAIYWLVSAVVFWASRRFERVARVASLAVALLDVPMVFCVQWATLSTSPSASGVAGFTVGVYVLLIILAALSLERWYILGTAAVATVFEVKLQSLAGVSVGGRISTVILLGLAALACSYARRRLVELVDRVGQNIAAQRRAEEALRQAERMASLGTLAAGVAHEINTPLTYVVTNLALIAERLSGPLEASAAPADGLAARLATAERALATARSGYERLVAEFGDRLSGERRHEFNNAQTEVVYLLGAVAMDLAALSAAARGAGPQADGGNVNGLLQQAREGAERVRTIVRDLKTFSRPDEESIGPVELRRVLNSTINLMSSEIQHRARLRTEFGDAPRVMANEARLGQVFLNLLVNAMQAIPEGAADRHEIHVVTRTDDLGRAVAEVRDTGMGIAPEDLGRLFDPFFTTKPVGEGTGLGLSICHGIVRALGGELSAVSEVGRGSTFRVVLPPAAPSDLVAVSSRAPTVTAAPRAARILVVDDDARIGDAVRGSLTPEHDVVSVTSAFAALQQLVAGEHFDLILCDLMMPAMTGMDLHEELARIEPAQAARMVFLTGGAFTPRARAFLAEVPNPRLDKPFDPQSLRAFVRELL